MVHRNHHLQVHCDLYLQHLQRDHRVCDRPLHSHSEVYFLIVINTLYVSFGPEGKNKHMIITSHMNCWFYNKTSLSGRRKEDQAATASQQEEKIMLLLLW